MSKRPSTTDPSVTEDGDAFLTRWARRKRVARSGGDPDATSTDDVGQELARESAEAPHAESVTGEGQPAELGDEDMPPIESIDGETDMSGFFSPKVTQAVKKAALKKFFHSPMFNIVDGLDDYDDDFRNFEALGDIITSDMRMQMEREAEKAKQALAKDADTASAPDTPVEEATTEELTGAADSSAEEGAADEEEARENETRAVTREPGAQARTGHGKLRPRGEDT